MELLHPSPPPEPSRNHFPTLVTPTTSLLASHLGGNDLVNVAVGKCIEKTVALLHWTFRRFRNREICLLHVHQPSPVIPTLLGKLPANQANQETVSAYREEERERTRKLLFNYFHIFHRAKVKASVIVIESGQVQKGIVDLVNKHNIKKLVMGAVPDNCMKVKDSSEANYLAKNAPAFCQIWFVNKGKDVWTRQASEGCPQSTSSITGRVCGEVSSCMQIEPDNTETTDIFYLTSITSGLASSAERRWSSELYIDLDKESLYNQFQETRREAEASKNEAFAELLQRKALESEAIEAIDKVRDFEAARLHEVELRKEIEDALRTAQEEQKRLLEQREELTRELNKTMRGIAVLDI
uniref:UspA domain-containing protein n=1 Tax=Nelumbo nucifera TaxID=4432 RepID=A0A822Z2D5_NELNU|nr:TPA_asm: hypothetical protein HUJ06_012995 [Nelumbo nucifera]